MLIMNGTMIAYCSGTVFCVQVGKGNKAGYKTRYTFKGNFDKARFYYESINIGRGYKKRLVMSGKVLAKEAS